MDFVDEEADTTQEGASPETLPADEFPDAISPEDFDKGQSQDFPDAISPEDFAKGQDHKDRGKDQDFPDAISPEDFDKSRATSSGSGAFVRGAAEGAVPAVGGLAAGLAAAGPGAAFGAAVGGPLAPITAPIGAIGAGVLAGMGAGWLLEKGQDKLLDLLGIREGEGAFSRKQQETDEAQHPNYKFAGAMAPSALLLRPGGNLAARAIGGGVGAAVGAGADYIHTGEFDPVKTGMAGVFGALMPSTNRAGAAIEGAFTRAPAAPPRPRAPGQNLPNPAPPPPEAQPGQPAMRTTVDINGQQTVVESNARAPEVADTVDATHPAEAPVEARDPGPYRKDIEFATLQQKEHEPGDEMHQFWSKHIEDLWSRASGKGSVDVDASLGPHSADNQFTPANADRANDLTTTSLGTAAENSPAPQVAGAGNPVGSPMEGRIAQRPSGPLRDYRKAKPKAAAEAEGAPSTPISKAPIHEDITAALAEVKSPELDTKINGATDDTARFPWQQPKAPIHDPIEMSRMQREGYQAAEQKVRAGQKGEAFEGLPDGPPAPVETGIPKRVTETVTPHEQKVTERAMGELHAAEAKEPGSMSKMIARMEALPPKERAVAATKLLTAMQSKTGEAVGAGSAGEVRTPGVRPQTEGGMTARSKGDAARKQGVLDAYENAVAKFGMGQANETQGQLVSRLTQMVKHADGLTGGEKYRPNVKPPAWQLVNQARKVVARPSPATARKYQSLEASLTGKAVDGKAEAQADLARETQTTERIESDIARRPQIEDKTAEDLISKNAADASTARPEHEHFANHEGEESQVYTRDHNGLTHWLNNLSDESHAALMKEHPDLVLDIKSTQDPHELMTNLQDDLAAFQRKKPAPTFEAVAAEDAPVVKRTRIKSASDIDRFAPTEAGKPAGEARVLDKNSPEFKAAAEAALNKTKKATYDLTHEEAAARGQNPNEPIKPVDGSEKTAWDHFADLMSDESGAVNPKQIMADLGAGYNWMKQKVTDIFSPSAADPIREYGNQLGGRFTTLTNRLTQFKGELMANARTAQFPDGTKPTPAEKGAIYRAMERGETRNLPGKLKDYYDSFVKPLHDKYGPMYDEYRTLATRLQMPGFEELPVRTSNGNGFMEWSPRIQKGKHAWDKADDVDPVTGKGQTLSHYAETAQERGWFALQNANGDRMVYIPGDGFITRMSNGVPRKLSTTHSNSFDAAQVGDTITFPHQGKQRAWTVDHATVDEITSAAGKDSRGKNKVEFHDSPVITYSNALYGLNNGLERLRLFRDIVESPMFQNNSMRVKGAKSRAAAEEKGWVPSKLPQFRDMYMPEHIAWALDDYVKRGFDTPKGSMGTAKRALDTLSTTAAKIFYFFGPAVHALNEADKWAIGRGFNWVTPSGYKSLVVNGMKAVKSVHAQDAIQREMIDNGANMMLMHTLTRDVMGKIAKATGDDIAKNTSKWDPFARAFGVSTKEMLAKAYDISSAGMWWASDVLATQRYLEEKARGLSPAEAVKSMHAFIDSYQMPTTVGGSGGKGRILQKFLSDPSTSLFGPYHYGVFHSVANMTKDLVGLKASLGDRARAAGQWATAAALMYAVYPLLSAGYAKLTGNENSEFEHRGISRVLATGGDIATGRKGVQDALRNLWTPSVGADTAIRSFQNKDFRGKDIVDPQNMVAEPKKLLTAGAQAADFLAGQLVSPYKTISKAALDPGATPGSVAQKFAESNLGLKTPSPGAEKYESQRDKFQQRNARARRKRPQGVLEDLINNFTD